MARSGAELRWSTSGSLMQDMAPTIYNPATNKLQTTMVKANNIGWGRDMTHKAEALQRIATRARASHTRHSFAGMRIARDRGAAMSHRCNRLESATHDRSHNDTPPLRLEGRLPHAVPHAWRRTGTRS